MICKTSKYCVVCQKVVASYNHIGKPSRYCLKCKEPEMVNIKKYNGKKYKTCSDYVETI